MQGEDDLSEHPSVTTVSGHESPDIQSYKFHQRKQTTHPRRSLIAMNQAELHRVRQMKLKEMREKQRARLEHRHRYILSVVAIHLGLADQAVEDFIIDGDQVDLLEEFVAANGRKAIMFFYQEAEVPVARVFDSSVGGLPTSVSCHKTKRVTITDGTTLPLNGICVFVLRTAVNKPVSLSNISDEVFFGVFDVSKGQSLLSVMQEHLQLVMFPALAKSENWGDVSQKQRSQFDSKLKGFLSFLSNAQKGVESAVFFPLECKADLDMLARPGGTVAASKLPDTVAALETLATSWCSMVEQILAESNQMRREADDTGPLAELEYWKLRTAKFTSLIEQIKSHPVKHVIVTLVQAKSKVIKTWKSLDCAITDYSNEAKDNLRFLYSLEKICKPLYECDPVTMLDAVPSVIQTIRMIHAVSRRYNTPDRMSSLFVKVTNQMVVSCQSYISEGFCVKVWDIEPEILLKRIEACYKLYDVYQTCYSKTKAKAQECTLGKPFEMSEMYVFGKFESLCKRLSDIRSMVLTVQSFSVLAKSNIESIETLNTRFQTIFTQIRKKNYNILDPRKYEFKADFAEFQRQISELETQLSDFFAVKLSSPSKSARMMENLDRFEKLNLSCLSSAIASKYEAAMLIFLEEVEEVQRTYQANYLNPPLGRNMPPQSGAIMWSRQLLFHMEKSIGCLRNKPHLLNTPIGKKATKYFNKMSKVLVKFELVHYDGWKDALSEASYSLNSTLLVRHRDQIMVNLDPVLLQLEREVQCMKMLKFSIPEQAKMFDITQLKQNYHRVTHLVQSYNTLCTIKHEIFAPLFKYHLKKVDRAMNEGLIHVTWASFNVEIFVQSVELSIENMEKFFKLVYDAYECRILSNLEIMSSTLFIILPSSGVVKIGEFLERTKSLCVNSGKVLKSCSTKVERAVQEILALLTSDPILPGFLDNDSKETTKRKQEEHLQFANECEELFSALRHRFLEALLSAVKASLDCLRKKLSVSISSRGLFSNTSEDRIGAVNGLAVFSSELTLVLPSLVAHPSLEEIQVAINSAVSEVTSIGGLITVWAPYSLPGMGQEFTLRSETASTGIIVPTSVDNTSQDGTYLRYVHDGKDLLKLSQMLSSIVLTSRQELGNVLTQYHSYNHLYMVDRDTAIKEFLERSPHLSEFEGEMKSYSDLEEELGELAELKQVGPILFSTAPLKLALTTEAQAWKLKFGRSLNKHYLTKMQTVNEVLLESSKKLNRPVSDLEDVRLMMIALDELKEEEINIDMLLSPIEECYNFLLRCNISVPKGEMDMVDSLRYTFDNLRRQATNVQDHLIQIQPKFRSNLLDAVEEFTHDLSSYSEEYEQEGPMVVGLDPAEANDRLSIFQAKFDELWRRHETCSGGEKLFGLDVHDYPELTQGKKELLLLQKLYGLYSTVNNTIDSYYDLLWSDVDIEKINNDLVDFQNKCRKLPKGLKEWQAFNDLKKKIDDFNECCPLLELMANKAMKERHWDRLATVTGHTFDVESETFSLRSIMEAPLLPHKEDIEDICISAVKERDIEAKLKQVVADWCVQNLSFGQFKTRGELLLKGGETAEVVSLMEDSLMVLGSLMSNRYNAPFKKDIASWVQKLSNSSDIIDNWITVQNLWVYLEAVFVGGDIAKQLPKEAKRFANIDKSWQKIMTRAHEVPNVVQCCVGDETLGQLLPHLLEQLELCQKSLTGYLEKKRLVFPRFFFVSDPALLEILGQASDSHTIQAHLLGIFDNVKSVVFHAKQYDNILAISSREEETVELEKSVVAQGNVETWLGTLLELAMSSLHAVIRQSATAIDSPSFQLLEFLNSYPAQVGLLGLQMIWTRDAEQALLRARHDKKVMSTTNAYFLDMLNNLIEVTTQDLTKFERIKYETLITIHVHQRDIFNDLVRMHIKMPSDFEWLKQSRFYFNEEQDKTVISITDVDFIYQNEFLGCTDRLVITPLTDRCYITLSQALGMALGGAPAGPAGTGKTETTKDMGKALGKYVVVFNCSDQMDYRGLGRIYKGLAQSGSWGCFDEFNRIDLPVLSVAAQQIHIVLQCKKERKDQFIFTDGDVVHMNPEFAIFLTMNPGYAGRQELPENLKVQFRTVAMMVPDRQIIMRVKLASCGFLENIVLARKFFTLYKLCEEQLSKQVHYDFGLRNILSVLRTLGANKRSNPGDSESKIVMRVLRDMNISKLVDEDEPLFLSLINDLFPGIVLDKAGYPELEAAIDHQVNESGLVNHPPWTLKLIQLYETQRVRHGMMVLGPSGAGKTCCVNVMMKAMTDCGAPHKEMKMNPKAITAPQMFGRLDVATNDWTDGIFSTLWRRTHKAKKGEHIWLILDGPVDAIWIENLNSVLDDNKTLTLANGDRIPMAPDCKIVFEPHNIDNASPATVSRNGMVYMSSSALDWRPILQGWLKSRPGSESEVLWSLFDSSFDEILTYVKVNLVAKMDILDCNYIKQATDLLTGLTSEGSESDDQVSTHHAKLSRKYIERIYVFAVMWSVGALLELNGRAKMQAFMLELGDLSLPPIQDGCTIFEYVVNKDGEWEHWSERVQEYLYPSDSVPEYASILVPNIDNVCTTFLMETICKQHKAVLLIGEQGTAKTVMIKGYASSYDPDKHLFKGFNFSSATTPMMFQRTIESYVDKRVGSTYGPPAGKKMSAFVDDINMPVINEWGDQVTNEIVRQMMEMKGMYSLEKPGDFTTIVDIQFMAAMIHPGGGRNDIPSRLKRQFTIFNCTLPANASIDKIFGIIGLGYFCLEREFSQPVIDMVKSLIPLTRVLWQQTKIKMLPTPAKFHYIFNLRDLSRIWEGMLHVEAPAVPNPEDVLALWANECCRVIADRFTNSEDWVWFEKAMQKAVKAELDIPCPDEPYFVDFLQDAPEATGDEPDDAELDAPKVYEQVSSLDSLAEKLIHYMQLYNDTVRGSQMDLVFFQDAMTHLVKVSRIIRTDRGNALLVGVGGSGKQSLTRLASFIAGYQTFQITLTRTYNASNLIDDLKMLYRIAGLQGKGVTFIFTDNEIKDEAFLEYLNNVLSSGEVANLFARDELDEITGNLFPIMKRQFPRRPPTQENLYDYFISRARKNLHVVLCFSPVGEKFRNRSLKFPGLISGCTMDWFSRWPKDALIAVARYYLESFSIVCSSEVKEEMVQAMGVFHDFVAEMCTGYFERYRRSTHVTPKSYLSFLAGYKTIYSEKKNYIGQLAERMNTGLDKLVEASESVALLSIELVVKEKELAVASEKAGRVLTEVAVKAQAAEKVKAAVQKVKDKAQALVDDIEADNVVATEKLEKAKPALEQAEAALQTIKAAHISTVRKLAKPPHLIMRIMDCVLLLFQKRLDPLVLDPERPCPKPAWAESMKLMSQSGFLQNLMTYNKDVINEEMVELLAAYQDMEDYTLETARKVCGDVAGLLAWTVAMVTFYGINREVLPLKANLAIQQARLVGANEERNIAQAELDAKQKELDEVQAQYDAAMKEKQTLLDDAETCRRKMLAASALINGLGGEKERWTAQSKEFQSQIGRLVGDVLLATAFLSYSGPFNQEFRNNLSEGWSKELTGRGIPFTNDLNLTSMLADNTTIGEWNLQGLPNDELSVQNGIIVTKATRYPLLMDPQGQGKSWIKRKEKNNELQVTSLNHKYFRSHLEDGLSLGRPLLIEDVGEELDPALDNVLEKNFMKSGSTYKVKVGDKECDVMSGFMLYITTKLPNPAYTPEVSARTSIIDFTVTMKGLEDQLLGRVILREKQELESERVALMEDVQANKKKMKDLEDNLLYRLTSTQGSLVDDESLIGVLANTKETATEVSEKLAVAADTEIKITGAREEFRPVALRGSILYFLIVEMSMVNIMYQTSLKQFLGIFDISMDRSVKSPITTKRIVNIIEYLTFEVFRYTCRGLYEEHKFLFTLLLPLKIGLQSGGSIKHEEFQILVKGGAALDLKTVQPKPFKWVTDVTWLNLVQLSKLPQFTEILTQVSRNERGWKQWYDSDAPEEAQVPDGYHISLGSFRKLLLIRSWCPDRTLAQARKYIGDAMGKRYAESVILDLEETWGESDPHMPLVCFLSMGSDPTNAIEGLAKKLKLSFSAISMGQGQEIHARRLLSQCISDGGWLLLQNCHLGLNFMDELLETILDTESMHETCRAWITTEVHPKFPISFLQSGIKFTNEPPQGVKAGLRRTYANVTQDQLDISNLPQWKPLLYGVAFIHTTVQERRKFGPLGWNIPYEFNQSDLSASIQFIQNHLDDLDLHRGVCWNTVRYMMGEVQYGGRVTDDFDKRLLTTYCKVWLGEHMYQESFNFYKGYTIPHRKTIDQYREAIDNLPLVDTPQVFGLHTNADITYQSNMAQTVLQTIMSIQPKDSSGGGGETRETTVYRLADDMLEKLPKDYLPHEVKSRLNKMGALASMNIFLRQEIDRMQRVISNVRTTLQDLKLAIDGTIIMSEYLRDALDCMYDAKVPSIWLKISWDSSTLGFWFMELLERNVQFSTWVFQGRPNVFWMTGFFNPQGFLTAMRQEVTRAHKGWALDSVILHNDVTKMMKDDVTASPQEGVYVHGLYLDGAGWDRKNSKLMEQQAKVLFCPLPVIHLYAVNTAEHSTDLSKLYSCPVYKKPRRTDLTYITAVYLKISTAPSQSATPSHWVLRGVALLCDIK
uniref:Axonemal dynein heavy chain A n=1 Tax=Halisarca dujardinii TaxID=2583056 RepID=A0A9F1U3Z7_HALDU|nr:axonemal dynein heavy chain A [Halisarca dujardinii]